MKRRNNYPLADDGWKFFLPVLVIGILCLLIFPIAGFLLLVLAAFLAFFFRNPIRIIPSEPDLFVAPADGKVLAVQKKEDSDLGESISVTIFLSIFNVHVTKSPLSGKIKDIEYHHGKFINALNEKSSDENEHNIITIEGENTTVKVKQIAGIIARRIVNFKRKGAPVKKGEDLGLIRFGSRVELLLPAGEATVLVKPGNKILGGQTPVLKFHKNA